MTQIAERLIELRKASGLSREQLAERLYVSSQAVGKWERGEGLPDIENLLLLSRLYDVSMDSLLNPDGADENLDETKIKERIKAKRRKVWKEALRISVAAVLGFAIGLSVFWIGGHLQNDDTQDEQEGEVYYILLLPADDASDDPADGKYIIVSVTGDIETAPEAGVIVYSGDEEEIYLYIVDIEQQADTE